MPVVKCSNGKWRIGNGSCVYDTKEKAVEVWQAILATGKYKTDDNTKSKNQRGKSKSEQSEADKR
jgi:hypothetical protein